jgi:hypothetical protein
MAQITSRDKLKLWLEEQQRVDWAQVIAARAALRVLIYAFGEETDELWVKEFALHLIRAISASWSASNFPTYNISNDAHAVADAARIAAYAAPKLSISASLARAAASAVDSWSVITKLVHNNIVDMSAAVYSVEIACDIVGDLAWANVDWDCNRLESSDDPTSAARLLTKESLWPGGQPDEWDGACEFAFDRLTALVDEDGRNQQYKVWIDWYNRRIEGHDEAFDIPGDTNRTEDKAILARLADTTKEDFWDKGATYVNTTLQGWIDEAKLSAANSLNEPRLSTSEAIRTIAAEIASPTVTLTNNKLDIASNTKSH